MPSYPLALAYVVTYFLFFYGMPVFFHAPRPRLHARVFLSLILILAFYFLIVWVTVCVPDEVLGNRMLHAFGGGFLALFMCFRVARDARLRITAFQFFVFAFLLVTALGVANEIFEFLLQYYFDFVFARTINDTWLDLVSNTAGAVFAGGLFAPFVKINE